MTFTDKEFHIKLANGNTIKFPNRFGDKKFKHIHVVGDVRIYNIKIKWGDIPHLHDNVRCKGFFFYCNPRENYNALHSYELKTTVKTLNICFALSWIVSYVFILFYIDYNILCLFNLYLNIANTEIYCKNYKNNAVFSKFLCTNDYCTFHRHSQIGSPKSIN